MTCHTAPNGSEDVPIEEEAVRYAEAAPRDGMRLV